MYVRRDSTLCIRERHLWTSVLPRSLPLDKECAETGSEPFYSAQVKSWLDLIAVVITAGVLCCIVLEKLCERSS